MSKRLYVAALDDDGNITGYVASKFLEIDGHPVVDPVPEGSVHPSRWRICRWRRRRMEAIATTLQTSDGFLVYWIRSTAGPDGLFSKFRPTSIGPHNWPGFQMTGSLLDSGLRFRLPL
jgi:hypothetical protein